jgi:hypothetical protein
VFFMCLLIFNVLQLHPHPTTGQQLKSLRHHH